MNMIPTTHNKRIMYAHGETWKSENVGNTITERSEA